MELTHTDVDRLLSRLGPEGGALYLPGDLDPEALDELLDARYGTARTLVSDGAADPAADASRGGALLVPFEGRAVSMRAWAYGDRWVGSGTARDAAGVERPVLAAARREVSIPPRGEDVDWVERLVAITGWTEPARRRDAAWAETESRLGTALPSDYKRIVDTFGAGAFDGYLGLNQEPWTHYREEGLLIWAGTEHEDLYCWRPTARIRTGGPSWSAPPTARTSPSTARRRSSSAGSSSTRTTASRWPTTSTPTGS
ncbi:hypothetical protein [Streptomyces hydrogenans]|uniref:hypothetical protein n=1 Tax=Streptomyces hydrogenans TaxID=1873719 RepID=UPI003431C073